MNGLADDFSGRVSHAQDAGLTTEEGRKLRRQGWLAVMLLVMRVADLVVIWLSGLAAYTGRFGFVEVPGLVMLALTFAVMMSAVVFSLGRAYSAGEADNFWASASRVLGQWALVCLLLIAAVFMSGVAESYSRGWAALWMTTAALGLVGVRAAGATLMRRARARGSMVTRVAIIGGDESGLQLHHYLKQQGKHIEVVGIYDDRFARLQDAARAQGVTLLGTAQDFLKRARYESVDCVVINLPWSSEHRVREMVEVLQELAIEVQICPEGLNFVVQSFPLLKNSIATTLGGLPMFSVSRRPLDGWGWLIKDIEDRILITLLAPIVLPLCLLIAIAIKFDSPGPVLFRQRRKGFNGREFMVYKFRSMRAADSVPTGVTKATLRDDPRVTFVGNILRRTSLDELPQLFNVLRGEMSIIGPRPHAVDHDEQFARVIRQYYSRHRVRPGITGWAQVNGLRGTIEEDAQIRRRVAHDLWYIENWSVFFDLRILLMTPFVGLINRNAY